MTVLALVLLVIGLPAQAERLQQKISLNGPHSAVPIRVLPSVPVTLSNDGVITLHRATITRIVSGARLAEIAAVYAGQKFNLEFSREGAYSICYFLALDSPPGQEQCLFLDVVPLRTAAATGMGPLTMGPLS